MPGMAVIITRAGAHLPLAFEVLRDASLAEDFGFLNRLEQNWRDGRYGDDAMATVRIFSCGDAALGVGARTYDDRSAHEMRRQRP